MCILSIVITAIIFVVYKFLKKKYRHDLKLYIPEPWLSQIQKNLKKVDARVGNFSHWKNREVILYNELRKFPVYVVDVKKFNEIDEYIDYYKLENIDPKREKIKHKKIYGKSAVSSLEFELL